MAGKAGTEAVLRAQIQEILDGGVTQRTLADKLLVSETWLSRWLSAKDGVKARPITVPEMDRFKAYVAEWTARIERIRNLQETQRSEAPTTPPSAAGGSFR
jgi:transcriptional regulator with XRE-family HTH domain